MTLLTANERTGACLCKRIGFRTMGEEINVAVCHCTNCRRHCGSAYTANAWFPNEQFEWTCGADLLRQHDDHDTSTGEVVHRWFCIQCGSPMSTKSPRMPGVTIVPCGLFHGQHAWKPKYEQWRCSRLCFVDDIKGVHDESRYDGFPDIKEFERIWAKL
ncbi:Mss4-like protein [Paraphoma chrysanthemicola]|nr:Mss4-like protein [Paraphoma chrysanthemicola]